MHSAICLSDVYTVFASQSDTNHPSCSRVYVANLIWRLPNSSFYATTVYDYYSLTTAYQSSYSSPYAWSSDTSASGIISSAGEEYLQIDLLGQAQILAIGTKGGVIWEEWVTSYKFRYSNDSDIWIWYNNEEILTGNQDQNTEQLNILTSPIIAQYIRIYPMSAYYWVGMRVEAYGTYDLNATFIPGYFVDTCMIYN